METQLRKAICEFLTPLPAMQSENQRRAVLLTAGLDTILRQTDLRGTPHETVPLLLNALEHYGLFEGEPALVVFLREIATQVGEDKQKQIQDFCERLLHDTTPPSRQTRGQQQRHGDSFDSGGGPLNSDIVLRSEPITVSEHEFKKVFGLNENRRPLEYIQNHYEDQGEVVLDHATGLIWQKSGSEDWLTYNEAQKYVKNLNQQKLAGYDDWRLPSVPELMSLLEPEKQANGLYISPIFETHKYEWCWSADQVKGSRGSAWLVTFYYGSVRWRLLGGTPFVRAVRS